MVRPDDTATVDRPSSAHLRWGPKDDVARFLKKIDRNGPVFKDKGPCWLFTAGKTKQGYGMTTWGKRQQAAHVVSYEIYVGPVPSGKELDHLCRNPACVNPDHLEPVTHKENMARGVTATKTACIRGHTDGWHIVQVNRRCRICERIRDRARYPERYRLQKAKNNLLVVEDA